jgi:tRNA (mo5U34)-methyltransferase
MNDIRNRMNAIRWYHSIDLGNGCVTPGVANCKEELKYLQLPGSLAGKTVLDIGAWDGFYSFEAERRGARRVLATDHFCWSGPGWGTQDGFNLAREILQSQVEDLDIDVMELSKEKVGQFDITFFLGVLYHLRHPLYALELVADVTKDGGMAIIETHVDLVHIERPVMAIYPGTELSDDPTNWNGPNIAGAIAMLKMAGFRQVNCVSFKPGSWEDQVKQARTNPERVDGRRAVFHAYK